MADVDPHATQQDLIPGVAAELRGATFDDVEEIGRGGFGVVYRCAQPQLDRWVAVKVLTADLDPDNLDRFIREQRAMGRLSGHPHIVTVLQVGTTVSGRPFIVMPFCGEGSLEALIGRRGPLDWRVAVSIGVKLAGALEAGHRAGILHRDVKPGNILLTEYGEPQLCDFGIARIAGGFETGTGVITGSPAFTAPEVLEGATPTPASDVYSLGATLFCALTGHAAFERRTGEHVVAQFVRITSQPSPDLRRRGLPDDVAAVIERAMARDPGQRPTTAAGFGEQLRDIQRHHRVTVDEMATPVALGAGRGSSATAGSSDQPDTTPAPPTPATRYRPAAAVRSLVPRDRLMAILRGAGRRRLILIHAPSGYGKSTLAAQWRAELASSGVAVGWLTVDDDDNNVAWFLAHLLEAIRGVRPTLAASLGQVLEERGDEAARYVLTALIDDIHQNDDPITLVIDDWQRVSESQTIAALRFLLDKGCHHLQIVVTSWSRAGLPVSRLRMRDEVIEIDCASLRFDADEAQSLLNDIAGLQLAGSDVAALTASTDGWVAALQLATLSLRGGGDASSLLSRMSGENDAVGEFLADNVLDTLEPELADFMLATSITQRTCGELASVLAGVSRGQAVLEDVERRGLFLQRIDDDPHWFRYHQMFGEFLRRRLERDSPERLEHLHRSASAWFANHGCLNDAVDHALAAGESTRAVDLVEQDQTNLIEQSRMTTFLGIVEKLPPQLVASRARLQLVIAWANILLQRPAATDAALNRFSAAVSAEALPDVTLADLTVEAQVVRAVAEIFADRVDAVPDLVAEAMSRPDTLRPLLPGVAANVAAFAAIYRFDFDAAHRLLEWASPYHELVGPFARVYAHCFAGIAERHQLDIPAALNSFREAFEIGTAVGAHSHAARLAGALLGELLYETGDFAKAAHLLDESYHLGPEGGGVDYLAARYATGARIKAAQGNRDAAVSRLAAGMTVAEKLRLPRLAAAINHERVRLRLPITPSAAARLRAARSIPRDDDGIATMTAELDEASAIRLLSRSDAGNDREQACRRAGALLARIDPTTRPLAALQARLLLAEVLTGAGRAADTRNDIELVCALCTQHGLPRLLIDAGLG
ncbi:MAG TPA: protein kinase [Mycobacterium sp.]|nr:protein kinase [Mycobacterium sp.]